MCTPGGSTAMRISMRPGRNRLRHGMPEAAGQGGAIMMFVLLASLLLAMITLGVMRMFAGDIADGFGALEAVEAANIPDAGAHYVIGQYQTAGQSTYAG